MKPASIKLALAIAVVGTVLTAFTYAAVQQSYRSGANDPQVQLAEDGANALMSGMSPFQIVGNNHVEASTSLAPFVTVFGPDRQPLATNGQFKQVTLAPPAGTFDYAKAHGQDRFTWAPGTGNREAAVLVYNGGANPGYVLAARDLREVEDRESNLAALAGAAVGVILVVTLALLLIAK